MVSRLQALTLFLAKIGFAALIGLAVIGLISWGLGASVAGYASALRLIGALIMIFGLFSLSGSGQNRHAMVTPLANNSSALSATYSLRPLGSKAWNQWGQGDQWGAFRFMLFTLGVGLLFQLAHYLIQIWWVAV